MKIYTPPVATALPTESVVPDASPALEVNITAALASVSVMHQGQSITIMRNQNQTNVVNPDFATTSRKCPPFCIQPSELAPGVTTIGELEVLHFLKTIGDGDTSMMVIDSRTPGREDTRIIPGTVNIPWDKLDLGKSDPITVHDILENQLDARAAVMFTSKAGDGCGTTDSVGNAVATGGG